MKTITEDPTVFDTKETLDGNIQTVKTDTGYFSSDSSESSSSESDSEQENEKKDKENKDVQAQASRKRKRKKSKYNKKNIDVICKTCGKTESIKFRGFRSKRLICNSCFFRHRRLLQSQAELRDVIKQIIEVNDVEKGYELVLQSNILLSNSRLKKTYNKQKSESAAQAAAAIAQTDNCDSVKSIEK